MNVRSEFSRGLAWFIAGMGIVLSVIALDFATENFRNKTSI